MDIPPSSNQIVDSLEPSCQNCIVCSKQVDTASYFDYIIIEDKLSKFYKDSICRECATKAVSEWLHDRMTW